MSARDSWNEEMQSAFLYQSMAAAETDPTRRQLFESLRRAALSQAQVWGEKLRGSEGAAPAEFRPSVRARMVAAMIGRFGPRRLLPVLAAMKVRGLSIYRAPAPPRDHRMPTSVEQVGGRHRGVSSGGNLRAAVFGINDGLVSNTSLIMGIAGATGDPKVVLFAGVAGLLAGAFSMAAGEYVSMRSQREMFEYQIALEREELALYPEEEQEELALIYNARGLPLEKAREIAAEMLHDPEHALDTLSREELGLNPDDLGSPWGAAGFSFLAFAAGALLPLLPFLLLRAHPSALPAAAVLAGTALVAVGATLSLFSGRSAVWGGVRMLLIGGAAGVATYTIGTWLGVTLA